MSIGYPRNLCPFVPVLGGGCSGLRADFKKKSKRTPFFQFMARLPAKIAAGLTLYIQT
jgi:hypothetical protein